MKNVDYIIVGQGFAGSFFAYQLLKNGKSFIMYDSQSNMASQIAAGVYNPVVLKRFNVIWKANELMDELKNTMNEMENILGENFLNENPVYRVFHDEREEHTWLEKGKSEPLKDYLNPALVSRFPNLKVPYKAGKVNHSGRIYARAFLASFRNLLKTKQLIREENFDYQSLEVTNDLKYNDIIAKNIVFAEGSGVKSNPYFKNIPIGLNKGQCIHVKLEKPLEDNVYKKQNFLFPLEGDIYYAGATYDRHDKSENATEEAKIKLLNNLKELYSDSFKLIDFLYAFRPVTQDRRPVLGAHSQYKQMYIFNGLGSRGTLLGAYFSKVLYEHIENGTALEDEVKVERFKKNHP